MNGLSHRWALLLLLAGGCPLPSIPDGGSAVDDGGGHDAGPIGAHDAGLGQQDGGEPEAGPPLPAFDAGTTDGGNPWLPPDDLDEARSLVWTDASLLDDTSVIGLARLMGAAADDGHGGRLFAAWLERFATTAHSERVGPLLLKDEIAATYGDDPSTWDLDALPFKVTGVHNRIDLKSGEHCGELRVSLTSTHATYRPFHLIFLFRQLPQAGDHDGVSLHCRATARAWIDLSLLVEAEFFTEAQAWLDQGITADAFALAESLEFMTAPWEWRQWVKVPSSSPTPELPSVFENPPLFQTVDVPAVNAAGPLRASFLSFVEENAAALDARTALVPEEFRASSARVNDGVPWIPLSLDGVDPAVLSAYPNLRGNLEIVGCPACHTADAEFVQTRDDRTFSPFYEKELDARATSLLLLGQGTEGGVPFGPLQSAPVLH